jgi:hypothetical protein
VICKLYKELRRDRLFNHAIIPVLFPIFEDEEQKEKKNFMAWYKILLLVLCMAPSALTAQILFNQLCFNEAGNEFALLRVLPSKDDLYVVNTSTLQTQIRGPVTLSHFLPCDQTSNYQNLKRKALSQSHMIQNRGLTQGNAEAISLTVDMCPSKKVSYASEFFKSLIQQKKSYPLTISMTKKWAQQHPKEFSELKAWDESQALKITWMNHGSKHPYQKGIAATENFINLKGVDFKQEVLENEDFLIKEGCVPSIFYRFAGLVSNDKAYKLLIKELGLIPIGSQAWLAKGEKIKEGSIVLVHGNGNDTLGDRLFLERRSDLQVIELPELLINPSKG